MNLAQQLSEIINDLQSVKTETSLIAGAIVLLISGLITKSGWVIKGVFVAVVSVTIYLYQSSSEIGLMLSDAIQLSPISKKFISLFLVVSLILVVYKREQKHAPEFYFFLLSLLIGSIFIMEANSLLIIYLSIELASFSSYILTNFSFRKMGHEAGIKYLLFGAISSAVMLFGLGIIYGTTHTFFIHEWGVNTFNGWYPQIGLLMLLLGILFKASIVPLHIWVPATYQSAPNDATALMSIVPKLAALVLLQRIVLTEAFPMWMTNLTLILGILTIAFGTLGALNQSNVRRMISFGAIAHSGFLLPFVFMNSATSASSFWWYSCVYAIMNLAVFFLIDKYESLGIFQWKDYFKASKETWMGASVTIILISLVGLPPLAGFTAKFFLFTSLWEFFTLSENVIYLSYLSVAVLATIVSLFFYLRVPYSLFLAQGENDSTISFNLWTKIIATLFTIVLLLLFFAPQILQ